MRYYKLERNRVVQTDAAGWSRWYETANTRVAENNIGLTRVSTIFLGMDHSYQDEGEPILFETIIFSSGLDLEWDQDRASTWEEALKMQEEAVEMVRKLYRLSGCCEFCGVKSEPIHGKCRHCGGIYV